jgi:hypothetical protein
MASEDRARSANALRKITQIFEALALCGSGPA